MIHMFSARKKISTIALFISALIWAVFLLYSIKAIVAFNEYKAVDPKMELTLDRFHFFLRREFLEMNQALVTLDPLSDQESPLKTFHITVNQEDINFLDSDLPRSGKDNYVDAYFSASDDAKTYRAKLRYRGDNNYHWLNKKKSLRIKLLSDDVYDMAKLFNLVNPPNITTLSDVAIYESAQKLGLISPSYYPVRVFLNGEFMGVYMYLSQVDESLLRKNRRMPGSIYYGDGDVKGDKGSTNMDRNDVSKLWYDDKYWVKKGARNAEQKYNREDIEYFLNEINFSDETSFHRFFHDYFDVDAVINYMALDRITGTNHHDYHHNHKLYFDPYTGKFEFFAWDSRQVTNSDEKHFSLNPLTNRLLLNPVIDAEIDKKVYQLYDSEFFEELVNKYQSTAELIMPDLKRDKYRDHAIFSDAFRTWISVPFTIDSFDKAIEEDIGLLFSRKQKMLKHLENSSAEYSVYENDKNYYYINITVSGNSPIEFICSEKCNIKRVDNGRLIDINSSEILYGGRELIEGGQTKYWKFLYGEDRVEYKPQSYRFALSSGAVGGVEKALGEIKFINYVTRTPVEIKFREELKFYDNGSLNAYNIPLVKPSLVNFEGTVSVKETLVFDKGSHVNIEPGTTFLLDEGVSIFFYGKVMALGEKGLPIKFLSSDPSKQWGAIVVQGRAASGSKFDYVEFENGSVDSRGMIHYTAQFNLHDMDSFEVRNCKVGRNYVGDDAMHVAYSKGIIDSCVFDNARSDALDIDIADVIVSNNIFYKSGNDGLDIMTTKMTAFGNVFIDSGDKGISVGEWSDANIKNSLFLRSVIGVEIKDKSTVFAKNLILIDSKDKAVNLYNKNARYDSGGFLTGEDFYFLGNATVKGDSKSRHSVSNKVEGDIPQLSSLDWYNSLPKKYKNLISSSLVAYEK